MEAYNCRSHTVYKALERPALYFGLPMQLFYVVCAVPFLLGIYLSLLFWLLIPSSVLLLGLLSKKDAQIYNLLYLKLKTLGNRKASLYYGANAIFAQKYEAVEIFALRRQLDETE